MKIAVIGAGAMGGALATHLSKKHQVTLTSRNPKHIEAFAKEINAMVVDNNCEAIANAEMIILAVKPDQLSAVSDEISTRLKASQILVSALGGVDSKMLRGAFPICEIVRSMPNMPVSVGAGVMAFCENEEHDSSTVDRVSAAFEGIGLVKWLPEEKIDALTAQAGCGPAFVMLMMEAFIESGVLLGLKVEDSKELTMKTFEGAVEWLRQSGKHPAQLRWQVSSPGGSTIRGLRAMEESAVRAGIADGIIAAYDH